MKTYLNRTLLLFVLVLAVLTACKKKEPDCCGPLVEIPGLYLYASAWSFGDTIPDKYTCKAPAQVFPQMNWQKTLLNDVKSYVLIMDDPDAVPVAGKVWVHWVLYDIPVAVKAIPEGVNTLGPLPAGIKRGLNSFGDTAYGGPCPPSGQLHTYCFRLFGIRKATLDIGHGAGVAEIRQAMSGFVADSAVFKGVFRR